jgi:hypothetical protein
VCTVCECIAPTVTASFRCLHCTRGGPEGGGGRGGETVHRSHPRDCSTVKKLQGGGRGGGGDITLPNPVGWGWGGGAQRARRAGGGGGG